MKKKHKRELIAWGLILITGFLLYYTELKRVEHGYFENHLWIFLDTINYIIFFGLIIGYAMSKMLKYVNGK